MSLSGQGPSKRPLEKSLALAPEALQEDKLLMNLKDSGLAW